MFLCIYFYIKFVIINNLLYIIILCLKCSLIIEINKYENIKLWKILKFKIFFEANILKRKTKNEEVLWSKKKEKGKII